VADLQLGGFGLRSQLGHDVLGDDDALRVLTMSDQGQVDLVAIDGDGDLVAVRGTWHGAHGVGAVEPLGGGIVANDLGELR
ncbi:MAG: hypothetical protein Q613_PSC00296G0001, partial [Propionibacterium sp. DORA_15]